MPSFLSNLLRGFAMGSADIVPGVSGGTVALILGIYQRLIGSIRSGSAALGHLLRGDVGGFMERLRAVDWGFLVPLGLGIGAAVLSLSHLIEGLLERQPVRMAALFFGLVAGSVGIAASYIRHPSRRSWLIGGITAVVTFLVLGLRAGPVGDPSLPLFFGSGALAICAMILPGISGSFILLMVGMYDSVLGAVNDRDLVAVAIVALGAIVGLALFSTLLNRLLEHHNDTLMAGLVGLLVGSLRVLWPWPDGTAGTALSTPGDDVIIPILLAIAGAAVVRLLARMGGAGNEAVDAVVEPVA